MAACWSAFDGTTFGSRKLTNRILQQVDWWGKDLCKIPELSETVAEFINTILSRGMRTAMALAAGTEIELEQEASPAFA